MKVQEFLDEFVSLPSVSSDPTKKENCLNTAQFLANFLYSLGMEVKLGNAVDGKNPIVMGRLGKEEDARTLVLYGHYDVQPAQFDDGWDTEPFHLTEKDGYLYGRGATDCKGPTTTALFALKELMDEGDLPVNIRVMYEGEEESGSAGFEETITANKDFFGKVDGIVIMDNYWLGEERACLSYGLRGLTYMAIKIKGPSSDQHSGSEGGVIREPMTDLIELLNSLVDGSGKAHIPGFYNTVREMTTEEEKLFDDIEFDVETHRKNLGVDRLLVENVKELLIKRWREPTLSIHGIEGAFSGPGGKTVIPRTVIGKVSMRLVPDQDPKGIADLFRSFVEAEFKKMDSPNHLAVETLSTGEWWVGDPSNYLFSAADEAIQEVWKHKPMYTREGGSIPIVPFLERTFEAPAMMLSIGQGTDGAHSQNEKIRILNLENGVRVLKKMLTKLGESS